MVAVNGWVASNPSHSGSFCKAIIIPMGDAVDIAAWLRELGLERYEPVFRDNEIDAEVLPRLTAEDLTALGVTAVGQRRKLLDAVAALRKGNVTLATGPPELAADSNRLDPS